MSNRARRKGIYNMKEYYLPIVKACDRSVASMLSRICVDADNFYRGTLDDMTYLTEPDAGCSLIHGCLVAYSCAESRYYRDPEMLRAVRGACEMLLRTLHPDGTVDFLATNYYTPATFEIQAFCRGYNCFVRCMQGTAEEEETKALLLRTLEKLASGCLNGGFHTPNHRWVECGAMLMSYNILGWPELLKKVKSYLSEGIDCDEYGEFTERSMGCYNPINVNSMMVMAEEGHMPELYEYAKKNLDLTFQYLDGDGTLFTRNSRRQDKGNERYYPAHNWYYLYLWAGELFGNRKYLKFARDMMERSIQLGLGVPGCLWLYLLRPQLKELSPDLSGVEIADHYHAFYPNSNILRVRKGDFSYTLVANNPDFLHIKFGEAMMTVRMCSSFFAVAQFAPEKIEKTETGYRMTFRGHGEYKGLFPEPPETSDWFKMDHSLRPVLHSCDLDYTLDVIDLPDGVRLNIRVDNTPRVPFKLEFAIEAGTRLETDNVIMDTVAGGSIAVKEGRVRLENVRTGSEITLTGLFAEHMYHRTMRGSIPPAEGTFTLYATDYSPIDRTVEMHFSKRTHARAMREKV